VRFKPIVLRIVTLSNHVWRFAHAAIPLLRQKQRKRARFTADCAQNCACEKDGTPRNLVFNLVSRSIHTGVSTRARARAQEQRVKSVAKSGRVTKRTGERRRCAACHRGAIKSRFSLWRNVARTMRRTFAHRLIVPRDLPFLARACTLQTILHGRLRRYLWPKLPRARRTCEKTEITAWSFPRINNDKNDAISRRLIPSSVDPALET